MKNIFLVFLVLTSLTFVSADILQLNDFVYNSSSINNVGILGFSCANQDCSSGQVQFVNSNSNLTSFFDVRYPNKGQRTYYGLFIFKEGYIPYERNSEGFETEKGDKREAGVTDYLTKKALCSSPVSNLVITNISNSLTIKTNVSASINHAGNLNFVPVQLASYYSVNVTLFLKVNGLVNQTRALSLPFSGTSEQTFNIVLSPGTHSLEIISVSSDAKCLLSDNQSKTSPITIVDTVAPVLNLPSTIYVNTTNISGIIVSFNVNATDNIDPAPLVLCNPNSGSLFSLGTTSVFCNATDSSGNTANGFFNVTVSLINSSNVTGQIPIVTIISPLNGLNYNSTQVLLNATSNQVISNWFYSLDGAANTSFMIGNYLMNLSNGTHNLNVYGNNSNGTGSASVLFFIYANDSNNTNPGNNTNQTNVSSIPIVFIISPLNGVTLNSTQVLLNATSNQIISNWKYSLDGGANASFSIGDSLLGLSNGTHTLRFYASNANGTGFNMTSFNIFYNSSKNQTGDGNNPDVPDDDDSDNNHNVSSYSSSGRGFKTNSSLTEGQGLINLGSFKSQDKGLFGGYFWLILAILILAILILAILIAKMLKKK